MKDQRWGPPNETDPVPDREPLPVNHYTTVPKPGACQPGPKRDPNLTGGRSSCAVQRPLDWAGWGGHGPGDGGWRCLGLGGVCHCARLTPIPIPIPVYEVAGNWKLVACGVGYPSTIKTPW